MFIGNYGNYQLSAVPGMVYQAYGLTDAQFSSLMTGPMLPSIFLSIVIGLLVDRYGISKIVGICFAISSIGFIVRVFATNYATMLIGGVVIPTYVVVPLGHGNIMTYFWLGALCILISAILCFIMANNCGVYKKGS